MLDLVNHTLNLGCIFFFQNVVQPLKTKSFDRRFLVCRSFYGASNLFNFYGAH